MVSFARALVNDRDVERPAQEGHTVGESVAKLLQRAGRPFASELAGAALTSRHLASFVVSFAVMLSRNGGEAGPQELAGWRTEP
jgi:hypothetical protein